MTTEQRLEQLEQQCKRQRWGLGLLTVAICGIVTIGASHRDAKFQHIEAERIVIRNTGSHAETQISPGNIAVWEQVTWKELQAGNRGGVILGVYTPDAIGDAQPSSGFIKLSNGNGVHVLDMHSTRDGAGLIEVRGNESGSKNGTRAVTLSVHDGAGSVVTYNSRAVATTVMTSDRRGNGLVSTAADNGKAVAGLSSTASGSGRIETYRSSTGKTLVHLGATKNGGGSVVVKNHLGDNVIMAQPDSRGSGAIGVWDRDGEGVTVSP